MKVISVKVNHVCFGDPTGSLMITVYVITKAVLPTVEMIHPHESIYSRMLVLVVTELNAVYGLAIGAFVHR